MKRLFFIIGILSMLQAGLYAQNFKWGIKAGIGTSSLRAEAIQNSNFKLAITDAKFGYYGGLFASFNRGSLLFQPELLFNSNKVDYVFKDFKSTAVVDSVKSERYNQLDIPLLLGAKVGPFLVKGGPVAHIHLSSKSDLTSIAGFTEKWKTALWGYHLGIGLNFTNRTHVDIRYEGNFDKWGSHINIGGTNYSFAQRPSRWLVNIGYAF